MQEVEESSNKGIRQENKSRKSWGSLPSVDSQGSRRQVGSGSGLPPTPSSPSHTNLSKDAQFKTIIVVYF